MKLYKIWVKELSFKEKKEILELFSKKINVKPHNGLKEQQIKTSNFFVNNTINSVSNNYLIYRGIKGNTDYSTFVKHDAKEISYKDLLNESSKYDDININHIEDLLQHIGQLQSKPLTFEEINLK